MVQSSLSDFFFVVEAERKELSGVGIFSIDSG